MSLTEELVNPAVPEAAPGDPEDVAWALSTAEAMWARGDYLEGIKWVRKAAEAASDAENDARALALAKAASELVAIASQRARPSFFERLGSTLSATLTESGAPLSPRAPGQPSGALGRAKPSSAPPPVSLTKSSRPPSTSRSVPPPPPVPSIAPKPLSLPQTASRRGGRDSLDSVDVDYIEAVFDDEAISIASGEAISEKGDSAENVSFHDSARQAAADREVASDSLSMTAVTRIDLPPPTESQGLERRRQGRERRRDEGEGTKPAEEKTAPLWDASTTQNLRGFELDHALNLGDRATSAFPFPAAPATVIHTHSAPITSRVGGAVHDPLIQTSQAVRVIVWRDANGVHLAPSGTVVSAITIDAVLVALEPSADLTAWLSKRER